MFAVPTVKKVTKKTPAAPAGKYEGLTAASPAIDAEIEGTKISLLEHQRRTVPAMLDAEKCAAVGKYTAGILRDPLGSGKTHCIVALLALRCAPALTQIGSVDGCAVRRRYSRLFRTNIVFVGAAVLANWEAVFALTERRVAVVRDIRDLRRLHGEFARGEMAYDDILVKNGTVTAALDFPELRDTQLEFASHRSILSIFGVIFRDVCFGRVVLDDFDTLDIAPAAMIIPAWFTWYVSSTASAAFSAHADEVKYVNPYDTLEMARGMYVDQLRDITRAETCRLPIVSSNPDYVVESTSMTPVYFWKYYHKNPHAAAIAAIGALGHGGLAEMLNADALTTAAEAVGNAGLGVGGIFKKLLGDNHAAYLLAGARGRYCSAALDYCSRLGPRDAETAVFRKAVALRENCLVPGPRSKLERMVTYSSDEAIGVIKVVGAEAKAERDASGTKISRVRERLQEGECPIMCVALSECKSIFMLDCCQIVLSDEAINSACVKVHRGAGATITGECPMCRAKLNESMIIPIDAVNIGDIIEENVDSPAAAAEDPTEGESETPAAAEPGAAAKRESVKYATFVAIANGTEATLTRTAFEPQLRGLMVGVESRGSAPPAEKKFLYIAKYEETFRSLVANLDFEGRRYAVFRGLRTQKNEIVRRYWLPNDHPESLQIVLITDAALCAGVNLQNTTDIVAAHGMPEDPDIMSQFMARAARCGRKYDLHAHALLYEEEQF